MAMPPMKTPRLRLRLVKLGKQERFTADGLDAFEKGLTDAADTLDYRLRNHWGRLRGVYRNLHVAGFGEERYFWIGARMMRIGPIANRAASDPSETLPYFPEYDLHLAVTKAGGPRDWAYSMEGVWMVCQIEWLWGRQLGRFCDSVVDDMVDSMAEEREEETGEYEVRPVRHRN